MVSHRDRDYLAEHLPAKLQPTINALGRRLPAADYAVLLDLLVETEEAGFARGIAEVDDHWARVVAHFGPFAPAIRAVHEHVIGDGYRCRDSPHCAALVFK